MAKWGSYISDTKITLNQTWVIFLRAEINRLELHCADFHLTIDSIFIIYFVCILFWRWSSLQTSPYKLDEKSILCSGIWPWDSWSSLDALILIPWPLQACGKTLSCGHHVCETICHSGQCSSCPRSGPRTCPCGKTSESSSQISCNYFSLTSGMQKLC